MSRRWLPFPPSVDTSTNTNNSDAASNGVEMEDWNQSASFVNKPTRGWLHPDQKIADSGISYGVRYIGCLEVNTSMKSLNFDTRSLIAKECINRVCEAAGLKTVDKKRKVQKNLVKMIADKPNMDHAGANVNLTVTSSYLNLVTLDSGEVIAHHEMPKISFASGGDAVQGTLDFVSYVAKDSLYGRACFVLECGSGLAEDVITTIGQAFELRYKRFLKTVPNSRSESEMLAASSTSHNGNHPNRRDDPEYYNDLPGKVPPDVVTSSTACPLDNALSQAMLKFSVPSSAIQEVNSNSPNYPVPYATTPLQKEPPESLIDLTSSLTNIAIYRRPGPEYVNTTAVISNERHQDTSAKQKNTVKHDIFDMQPFVTSLSSFETEESPIDSILNSPNPDFTQLPAPELTKMEIERAALQEEPWFHGLISRQESESLVVKEGDFLVRESLNTPGQYVLTGMQKSARKHLLLVDPEGVIRTKDQIFDSVSHLIKHHQENCLPIISAESTLLLRTPVYCTKQSASNSIQV